MYSFGTTPYILIYTQATGQLQTRAESVCVCKDLQLYLVTEAALL